MAIPAKVTSSDQIKDGFRKVNETIDNIVTGLTYDNSTKNLTLSKLNGDSISTNVNSSLLINGTNIVTASGFSPSWVAPFTATTYNQVYDYIFGIPYTIDMNNHAGKYFNLTTDATVTGSYDPQRYFNINLVSREVDGDSFVIKINSNHTKPSVISSTTQNFIIQNNHSYLFTYSSALTTWYNSVIDNGNYNQLINEFGYYENIDIYGFHNFGSSSALLYSSVTGNNIYKIKQTGKVIIDDNVNTGAAVTNFYLPSAGTFPYETIEIIDLSQTFNSSNYANNGKKIMTIDGTQIKIPSNSNGLPFIYLNEVNRKYIKFISDGVYWHILQPTNVYDAPINFPPKFTTTITPANTNFTASTSTLNGCYNINQGKINYSFFMVNLGVNTTYTGETINILLPTTFNTQYTANSKITVVTSSSTNEYRIELVYNGSSIPSMVKLIKTEYPSETYLTWSDIGINQPFKIYGEISYNIFGGNNNSDDALYFYTNQNEMVNRFTNYII